MDLSLIFQIISNASIIVGILFGLLNLRNFRAMRKRESTILMLNSFQTSEFVRGLLLILNLPDDIDNQYIDNLPKDEYIAIYMVVGTWERLGILVYRREVDLDLFDDAYSGPVIQSWQKLESYIRDFRARLDRDTAFEWFQWLAERMKEREEDEQPIPAYEAYRDWKYTVK
ncbi:MAG: DUF4760 domain-containing protein [Anaerolineales bacterium]|uniref:DUF4760 domain-containing protein n=1 Tax=Candidatus Desulfolinea nitratireducens TaxID=2841698 RepID=A0A8J6TED7_9CHLR|nr:DUF4760 domain-containing protein [Candidatus Desulfolinea nitratireducens]MBL6962141.1 DUF4760 domain-containing protein [Anaerolineales bacterium]